MKNVAATENQGNKARCPAGCRVEVFRARLTDATSSRMISVETVEPGKGDLGLNRELGGAELLATRLKGTRSQFAEHRCPPHSIVRPRKVRPW